MTIEPKRRTQRMKVIPKLIPVFTGAARVRGARGGRGSGKTRQFAEMAAVRALMYAQKNVRGTILCGREYMNSLEDSSFYELKSVIEGTYWLAPFFECGEKYIRTVCRRVSFTFTGLRINLSSVKSKARILIAWVDEAEEVSEYAWKILIPTIRGIPDAELWVTWNPERDGSATDVRFWKNKRSDYKVVHLNYNDNPYFPKVLEEARKADLEILDTEEYAWIWDGEYRKNSEAAIFKKYEIREFEPVPDWGMPLQGLDWGFSTDPTAAVRCYLHDRTLYVEYDFSKVGLELDDTAKTIKAKIPNFEAYTTRADNARPESISHVKSKGADSSRENLPKLVACKKGKGSVEHGISFIKSMRMVVHPRCTEFIKELRRYSYRKDRNTGEITTDIVDAHNHVMDALRYALEPVSGAQGGSSIFRKR